MRGFKFIYFGFNLDIGRVIHGYNMILDWIRAGLFSLFGNIEKMACFGLKSGHSDSAKETALCFEWRSAAMSPLHILRGLGVNVFVLAYPAMSPVYARSPGLTMRRAQVTPRLGARWMAFS